MTAVHTARQRVSQSDAVIAANQMRRRRAQAIQLAAVLAAQEDISLDTTDETTFLASIRGLSEAQRLGLRRQATVLFLMLGALLAPQETARHMFWVTDFLFGLAELLAWLDER